MDQRIAAVLDLYHRRIEQERALRQAGAAGDRQHWHDRALLAVGPQTGQLINILARSQPSPNILELGTSFGYSGIWLADAARASGGRLTTLELAPHKSAYARDMATQAGLAEWIDFRIGDAVELIGQLPQRWDFVLVDLWKDLYEPCLECFYPRLSPGAIIVADNMIRPGDEGVSRYRESIRAKPGIRSIPVPVGSGLEISCYLP